MESVFGIWMKGDLESGGSIKFGLVWCGGGGGGSDSGGGGGGGGGGEPMQWLPQRESHSHKCDWVQNISN
jgi:hypothetical protein